MSTTNLRKAILAINPTASAEYFRRRMAELRLIVIGFFTTTKFPSYSYDALNEHHYHKLILSNGVIEDDVSLIENLKDEIDLVSGIIGTEVDVEYAQLLLSKLFPNNSNDSDDSVFHYKKFEMNERLHHCGIPSLRQIKIDAKLPYEFNEGSIIAKFGSQLEKIVLKPSHGSAASKDVMITSSLEEVRNYLIRENLGLFYTTDEIVVQELAVGDEYFVDCCSYQGQHQVSAVFKYHKQLINGAMVYRYKDILEQDSFIYHEAQSYVKQSLDALNYRFGFSHTEIILTENGFRLIEMNPRISGMHGTANYISKLKYNLDQLDLYANSILAKPNLRKSNSQHYRCHFLNNFGFNYSAINVDILKKLASFNSIIILKPSGTYNGIHNLTETVAFLILAHQSQQQMVLDSEMIMKHEQNGALFSLA